MATWNNHNEFSRRRLPSGNFGARSGCTNDQEWVPVRHSVVPWSDEKSCKRMTVIILMPTGVGECFSFRVVEGTEFELTIQWPQTLFDVDELHKPLLKSLKKADSGDFLLKTALNKSVKKLMKAKDDRMVSRCQIQLPMVSNGETEPHLLAGDDGCLVFY